MNGSTSHLNKSVHQLPNTFNSLQPSPQHTPSQMFPESQSLLDGVQMTMMMDDSAQPEPIESQKVKHVVVLDPAKKNVLTSVSDLSTGRKFHHDIFHIGRGVYLQHIEKSVSKPNGGTFKYNAISVFRIGADGATSMSFDIPASLYDSLYTALDKMVDTHPPTYSRG